LYLEQHQNSDSFQTLLVGGCSIPKTFIMTDNKNKKDARDRNQVAGRENIKNYLKNRK